MAFDKLTDSRGQDDRSEVSFIIADRAFPLVLETYLYALYTVLTAYFLYRRWFHRKTTALPVFMLFVTMSMFILFSAYWALDVYLLWIEIYRYLPQEGSQPAVMFLDGLWIPWSAAYYAQTALQIVMLVLGDTVSLWRAYVVWGRPRWLFILFTCIAAIESVMYIFVLVVLFAQSLPQSPHGFSYNFYARSYTASFLVSNIITACAQMFATLLIMYKGWIYWRAVREFSQSGQTRYGVAMLAVFIETSIVYFAFLLWFGFIDFLGTPDSLVYAWVFYYMTPLIAMYPTLVVVLATTRRSVLERQSIPEHGPSGLLFATNPGAHQNRDGRPSGCRTPTHTQIALGASMMIQSVAASSYDSDQVMERGDLGSGVAFVNDLNHNFPVLVHHLLHTAGSLVRNAKQHCSGSPKRRRRHAINHHGWPPKMYNLGIASETTVGVVRSGREPSYAEGLASGCAEPAVRDSSICPSRSAL
ncbi:unnamed protein product [Peniophora sp. CBMAI 1063]|nr:unnamed protein product [Peniophora sp. CBMAI 1063]